MERAWIPNQVHEIVALVKAHLDSTEKSASLKSTKRKYSSLIPSQNLPDDHQKKESLQDSTMLDESLSFECKYPQLDLAESCINRKILALVIYLISTGKSSPDSVSQCPLAIYYLNLQGNKLRTLPNSPQVFLPLENLRILDLSHCSLVQVAPALALLKNLEKLDLDVNKLQDLPPQFGALKSLTFLSLSGNRFQTLPKCIGGLEALTHFTMRSNILTEIPENIFPSLHRLRFLNLFQNQLQEVPSDLSRLSQLQYLNLSYNQLEAIPDSLADLKALRRFYLTDNHLTQVPSCIEKMTALEFVSIKGNFLEIDDATKVPTPSKCWAIDLSAQKLPGQIDFDLNKFDFSGLYGDDDREEDDQNDDDFDPHGKLEF